MSRELILVIGASSDIGSALIRRLLASGDAQIVAHCHASADRIANHDRVRTISADLGSAGSAGQLADRVATEFGVPDQIVYLPGLKLRYERFTRFDLAHFDRDLDIQVRSAVALLGRLLPQMAKKPRARIVFVVSSVTRGAPPKFMSMYTIVKHAQLGLVRALAAEYAATGVTVNAVSPAMVETRFLDEIPGIAKEMATAAAPRGRLATPDDVVGAIGFLLSPASDFVTGIELPVTGGNGG